MKGSSIIVATDLSEQAAPAARFAHQLADVYDMPVRVVHVVAIAFTNWVKGAYDVLEDDDKYRQLEQEINDWYRDHVGQAADSVDIRVGHTNVQIKEAVEELDGAALMIGRSGKGQLKKIAVGSTALDLAHNPPCPTAIVHPDHTDLTSAAAMAVGVDFTPEDEQTVGFATELAARLGRRLHVVHASSTPNFPDFIEEELPEELNPDALKTQIQSELANIAEDFQADVEEVEDVDIKTRAILDSPTAGLIDFTADNDVDILVLGHHEHLGGQAAILTSVALRVVELAKSTVLIVPTESD